MDTFLKEAEKNHPGVKTRKGEIPGSPLRPSRDGEARPARLLRLSPRRPARPGEHPALQRVLAAIQGRDAAGKKVQRLGDTAELASVRTLMPPGTPEEDGLIYLSDPFIRRQVGPRSSSRSIAGCSATTICT